MAAVLTGTPTAVAWGTAQDPTSTNITVPADCTAVYMFWGYYDGGSPGGTGLASATLNGSAPSQTHEIANGSALQAGGVVAWYSPATGSRALDVAWDAPPSIGPCCIVVYVKDGDTTSWRDVDSNQQSATDAASVTLTTVAGDLVIKWDYHFDSVIPSLSAGWTNGQTQADQNGGTARVSTISAAGATQVCNGEDEQYTVVVALSIPAASGGGGSTPTKGRLSLLGVGI